MKKVCIGEHRQWGFIFVNNFQLIILLWQKVAKYLKQNKQLSFHQNKYDRN